MKKGNFPITNFILSKDWLYYLRKTSVKLPDETSSLLITQKRAKLLQNIQHLIKQHLTMAPWLILLVHRQMFYGYFADKDREPVYIIG